MITKPYITANWVANQQPEKFENYFNFLHQNDPSKCKAEGVIKDKEIKHIEYDGVALPDYSFTAKTYTERPIVCQKN